MRSLNLAVAAVACLATLGALAQTPLPQQLRALAAGAHGHVSVACALPGRPLACNLDSDAHPPMQSVFKLPLAVAVLHEVELGHLQLEQPVRFRPEDRILPHTYSPLQDKDPAAGVDIPLRELLRLAVSLSDNVAADMLLRTVGGPAAVDRILGSLGVTGFHLQDGEHALAEDPSVQYRNWWTPAGAVLLLRQLADHSPLNPEHTTLLLGWMSASVHARLGLDLPPNTPVAHKTGTSGMDHGLAAATNDIGLITLPDGRRLALAIFVTDSTAGDDVRTQVIARLSRALYDAALNAPSSPHP